MTVVSQRAEGVSSLQYVRPVPLAAAPKHRGGGPHRTASARTAWARVRHAVHAIGITRLADVTGLDCVGLPTWSAVRPLADRFSVSVTCGKGLRPIDARIGAVMEAVEYWSAEPSPSQMHLAHMADLKGEAIDPACLTLPSWSRGCAADPLAWRGAWDLGRHCPVWVPANAVHFPFEDQPGRFLFTPTTNGLAAGLVIEEAICHAMAELIERDAWSLVCARLWTGHDPNPCPALDLASVPASAMSLLRSFERAAVRVIVHVITSDVGVAAFHATSLEPAVHGASVHEGMGAHPDSEIALLRALTEVAQSRAADIQGSREDLTYWRARSDDSARPAGSWPEGPGRGTIDFAAVPVFRSADIRDDIEWMMVRLRDAGLDRVLVADLTSPALGLPVVRVIVPGLEVMCVDPWRIGRRVEAACAAAGAVAPLLSGN
jgi:ribosomal protein S12 methylthiotransferase accessory factor